MNVLLFKSTSPCEPFPEDASYKTVGWFGTCATCGSDDCWKQYLRWEKENGITLNAKDHPTDDCACSQEGDFCPVHPNCVCGCPKHAHREDLGCMRGKLGCACRRYRPAS